MMTAKIGSCLCGEVSFEIEGDFVAFYLCHCKYCQKDTGSAHAANLFSPKAKINWLKGEDKVSFYNLPNTRHVKSFCKNCGSALPTDCDGHYTLTPAGSLDVDVEIKPNAHIFCSSRANWDSELEKLEQIEKLP
jgi:hypothetical protein